MRRKNNNCRKFLGDDEQNFVDTVTEKKVKQKQREEQQEKRPTVWCQANELKNVYLFKYLGSIFVAGDSQESDVQRRINNVSGPIETHPQFKTRSTANETEAIRGSGGVTIYLWV